MVMSVQFQPSACLWTPNSPSPQISGKFLPNRGRLSTSSLAATPTLSSQSPTIQVTQLSPPSFPS